MFIHNLIVSYHATCESRMVLLRNSMETKDTYMNEIFTHGQYRDTKGRFCTKERHYAEKAINDNKILRLDREKYIRMNLALVKENARLKMELQSLNERIKGLIYG